MGVQNKVDVMDHLVNIVIRIHSGMRVPLLIVLESLDSVLEIRRMHLFL